MSDWEVNSVHADNTFYIGLGFDLTDVTLGSALPQLNNVTFALPSKPFLLQNPDDIEKGEICRPENREKQLQSGGGGPAASTQGGDERTKRDIEVCGEGFCDCSHVLDLTLGQVSCFPQFICIIFDEWRCA